MNNCSGLVIRAKVLQFALKGWDRESPPLNKNLSYTVCFFSIQSFSLSLFSAEGSLALWTLCEDGGCWGRLSIWYCTCSWVHVAVFGKQELRNGAEPTWSACCPIAWAPLLSALRLLRCISTILGLAVTLGVVLCKVSWSVAKKHNLKSRF